MYIYIKIYAVVSNRKRKTEAQVIFLNIFTVCSSCKWKFDICPFFLQRSKRNLSVFKQAKWTKQTKPTCLSVNKSI